MYASLFLCCESVPDIWYLDSKIISPLELSFSLVESDQKLNHIDENGEAHGSPESLDSRDQIPSEVTPLFWELHVPVLDLIIRMKELLEHFCSFNIAAVTYT